MIVSTGDHETSEVRLIPTADPLAAPILVRPREKGVEYDVDEREGTLFVHANDTHENFRLATAPLASPGEWTTLIEGSDAFYLTGFELFRDFYVVEGRLGGLDRLEIRYYDDPGADRADRISRGELLGRDSATIPNTRRPCCGCRTNRWSARRAPTTTTSPSGGSSCSRCRKSPRATTARSTRPSGSKSPRATARRSRSA